MATFSNTSGNDSFRGTEGDTKDEVTFLNATGPVVVDLTKGVASGPGVGNDTLISIEVVRGSNFNDTLIGNAETFALLGGEGNDSIVGGAGFTYLYGGLGNDTIEAGLGGSAYAVYEVASAGVTVNLTNGTATGGDGNDVLRNIAGVVGSIFVDSLTGDGQDNYLRGLDGNDMLVGGAGFDELEGNAGDDTLDGGADNDTVEYLNSSSGVMVDLARGIASGGDGNDTLVRIENASGGAFADTIVGDVQSNTLVGRDGDDNLNGGDGDDFLSGGAGKDTVNGGNGADEIRLAGNFSDYTITYYSTLKTFTVQDNTGARDGLDFVTNVEYFRFGDVVKTAAELIGSDTNLNATEDDDNLVGTADTDSIDGLGGADTLYGGGGDDELKGGNGADTFHIWGVLSGGGYDTSYDTIVDFVSGSDRLVVYTGTFSDLLYGKEFGGYNAVYNPFATGFARWTQAGPFTTLELDADGPESASTFKPAALFFGSSAAILEKADLFFDRVIGGKNTLASLAVDGSRSRADSRIDYAGDQDWYRVSLTAGTEYEFRMGSAGLSDAFLRLLGPTGEELLTDDDNGGSRNSVISFTPTVSADYYLSAQGLNSSTGGYTLTTSSGASSANNLDNIGSSVEALSSSLSVGSSSNNEVNFSGDQDWFEINLTSGVAYTFSLVSDGGSLDPFLRLLNSSGEELELNDDMSGDSNASRINYTPTTTGTYFLSAQGFGLTIGTYKLSAIGSSSFTIAATSANKSEGNSGVTPNTFTVTRSGDTGAAASVEWSVKGSGTFSADATDFSGGVLQTGTASFAPGQTTSVITVNVVGDVDFESDEGYSVSLSSPVGAALGTTTVASGSISNDDIFLVTSRNTNAKVYLGISDNFVVANSGTATYGSSGNDIVTVLAGATNLRLDQVIERILFPGASNSYTFKQTENQINVYDSTGTTLLVNVPLQDDADGTVLTFSDGTASALLLSGGVMRLGGATVSNITPSAFTFTLGANPAIPSGLSTAKAYLNPNDPLNVANSGLTLYGASGVEAVTINVGVNNVTLDQGIDRISFPGVGSKYTFKQTGNLINVYDDSGTTLIAKAPVQGDSDGTVLVFAGNAHSVKIQAGGVMKLDTLTVSNTMPTALFPSPTVTVNANGTISAAAGNFIYNIALGNYTYTIASFGAGDKIVGPSGVAANITNISPTDGSVTLQYSSSGQTAQITLTGLTTMQDGSLSAPADFNTLFGAGTLV